MATSPVNPGTGTPGVELTGVESQDLERLVTAAVQEQLKRQQLQQNSNNAPVVVPQSQPIEFEFLGQKFTAQNQAELNQIMRAVQDNIRNAVNALQVQASYNSGQNNTQNSPTGGTEDKKNTFSKEQFAELVGNDPIKGIDYLLSHMLFDGKVENAAQTLKEKLQQAETITTIKEQLAAYQFREMVPDFPASPQNFMILDQIRQRLGLPSTESQSWLASYAMATQLGAIRPNNAPPVNPGNQVIPGTPGSSPVIPPALGRSGHTSPAPNILEQAEQLPTEQLEAIIRKLQG
jgi:hypothetical protein